MILLVIVMFTSAIAGCIAPQPFHVEATASPGVAPSVAERLATDLASLPCVADYQRGHTSATFQEIAHIETEDVRYGEADLIEGTDLVVFARYVTGGFDIYDVHDPYEPELVTAFPIDAADGLDIKSSLDGKTLFSGEFDGITIIDISEPDQPEITRKVHHPEPYRTGAAQAHMIHIANISGQEYLFTSSQFYQGVLIYQVVGEPGAVDLEYVTVFAPAVGGPLAAHDMMVYHDPIEENPILWVANGFGGFIAADVSDPSLPIVVSYDPEKDPYQGYTHTISVVHYGDKRYAVTMAEIGAMALKVYDVTVMAAPILLATWTIDLDPSYLQHNTQIMGDWLWMGHYEEGVILFDLKAEIADLTLPAYNIGAVPALDSLDPYAQYLPGGGVTWTWESIVVNGVHWTTSGGIYGTLNGCFAAGDATLRAHV